MLYAGVEISEFLGCDEKLEKIFILIWYLSRPILAPKAV
jgi:hypothetical protein